MDSLAERISLTPSRLGGVNYRIANKGDYRAAHKLLAAEGIPRTTLGFPTIIAEDHGEIIGVLSTIIKDNMVIAGPLAVKGDRPRYFTIIRLIEAYEVAMRQVGVSSYIFHTDNAKLISYAKEIGMEPYAEEGSIKFFIRKL